MSRVARWRHRRVAKLRETLTGDTLGQKARRSRSTSIRSRAAMTYAIEPVPRRRRQARPAIHKLMEEDLLIKFFRDPQTNEFLIAAQASRISRPSSAASKSVTTLKSPQGAQGALSRNHPCHGRGAGTPQKADRRSRQFGDCKSAWSPCLAAQASSSQSEVFGGAIPRNFIPAIEKGIVESAARGYLAGYPVVDFRAVVYDVATTTLTQRNVLQDGWRSPSARPWKRRSPASSNPS